LTPELRAVWEKYRTASLRGHIGHNTGWDFALERMNLEVSTILGSNISPERIQETIRQLNGIRRVRSRALDALGIGDDSQSRDYNGVLEYDIGAVVHYLKRELEFDGNNDFEKFVAEKGNIFRSDGALSPWSRVSQVITVEPTASYVRRILERAPRNNIQ